MNYTYGGGSLATEAQNWINAAKAAQAAVQHPILKGEFGVHDTLVALLLERKINQLLVSRGADGFNPSNLTLFPFRTRDATLHAGRHHGADRVRLFARHLTVVVGIDPVEVFAGHGLELGAELTFGPGQIGRQLASQRQPEQRKDAICLDLEQTANHDRPPHLAHAPGGKFDARKAVLVLDEVGGDLEELLEELDGCLGVVDLRLSECVEPLGQTHPHGVLDRTFESAAESLLKEFGTIQNLYENLPKVKPASTIRCTD